MDKTQQWEMMRNALSSIGFDTATVSSFDEDTLDKLCAAKFHLPGRLQSATREDLKEANLAAGDASFIISKVQGEAAAVGVAGSAAAAHWDTTGEYLRMCLAPFPAEVLLTGQGLQGYIEGDLGQGLRLPVSDAAATELLHGCSDLKQLLVLESDHPEAAAARSFKHFVTTAIMRCSYNMRGSEMYTAHATMSVVDETLDLIAHFMRGPVVTMNRNTVDKSGATVKQCSPDFLCWVNNALLFKGEEKADISDLQSAVAELSKKMSDAWVKDLLPNHRMPCMLGFAAAGLLLQFFSIKTVNGQAVTECISDPYDLTQAVGRAGAVRATCNVYRLLAGYAAHMPQPPFAIGHTIHLRDEDGTVLRSVTYLTGFIRKSVAKFPALHAKYASLEALQDVYDKMKRHDGKIIQLARGAPRPRLEGGDYIVHLAPVGVPCIGAPKSEDELKHMLRGVLTGLKALHAEGFVHRDVRWANLIHLPAQRKWLLIDLEHVGKIGCNCSEAPYPLKYWCDSTLERDGTYTPYSDLDMVAAQLMTGLDFLLSTAAEDLRTLLQARSVTAEGALKHDWFRELEHARVARGVGRRR